jgi:hypothetical protein
MVCTLRVLRELYPGTVPLPPLTFNVDVPVKSQFFHFFVIPANAGIQSRRGGIQGLLDAGSSPA